MRSAALTLLTLITSFVALLSSSRAVLAAPLFNYSLSVYSTYPSDKLNTLCKTQKKHIDNRCIEDSIPVDLFLIALKKRTAFSALIPFEDGGDYELLIANLGSNNFQYTEFTVRWRGLEISNERFTLSRSASTSKGDATSNVTATTFIDMWLKKAKGDNVFSTDFLFSALQASDYINELNVPDRIGNFTKLDTQLYADPFNGAVTRYTHSQYEDALIDVTVYPFVDLLSVQNEDLLNAQLRIDLKQAEKAAQSQALTLSQSSPASPYSAANNTVGWRIGLKAESETSPAIYATTYVFRRGDKIVKVSTTFPVKLSDSIADELIASVDVPKESLFMKNIRQLLQKSRR